MISNIVKNIFWVLYALFITMVFFAVTIAASVWLATSGELIIIALIVAFVIGFVVMLALGVMSLKELIEVCREADEILNEKQNAEDKSCNGHRTCK